MDKLIFMSKKAPLFSFKYLLYDFVKWFGSWQCLLFYRINKKFDGKEAKKKIKGGAILVSNHVGFSDPFVLQCTILYRRFHFLCMDELIKNKFQGWIYKNMFLTTPISRTKPSFATIKYCSSLAEEGNLVCLFPEGHINTDLSTVDSFKGGAVLMAYRANVPIIPIYHQKRKTIWNMTRMVIGKPIDVREMVGGALTQDKINSVCAYLHEYEESLMKICETKKKK